MGELIDTEQKGWRSVIYDNDPYLLMTEVKGKDLLDSDWGDVRRPCDVDSCSEISAIVCWFSSFWWHFDFKWNRSNMGFQELSGKRMLMYPDHLQNW